MTPANLDAADRLIRHFEGFRSEPYRDQAGLWTIGYGSRFIQNGVPVTANTPAISQDYADVLLRAHIMQTATAVEKACEAIYLHIGQETACVSLAYNIGTEAFAKSTLCSLINRGCMWQAADEFLKWDHAGGEISFGLLARRRIERDVFLGGPLP